MARFYRTASAGPLDYMYRINAPLMAQVIGANDQYITDSLNQSAQLGDLATSFPYLMQDQERANKISQDFSNQIEAVTKAIQDDPANWRSQIGNIRGVKDSIMKSYRTGDISKIAGNYSKYKTVSDFIDKQVEQYGKDGKGISADRGEAYKRYFLNNFRGTFNPDNTSNVISVFNPMSNIDIRKRLTDELDKLKADKSSFQIDEVTGDGKYFNKQKNSWEAVTPEKVLGIMMSRINDPQLLDYMRQDSRVGLMSGVFDDKGNLRSPYEVKTLGLTDQEKNEINNRRRQVAAIKDDKTRNAQNVILDDYERKLRNRTGISWDNNNPLSSILQGGVNQFSYRQEERSNDLTNNSAWNTIYTQNQTNARQARNLGQQRELALMRENGVNQRFRENLDFQKYKWDNPHTLGGSGTSSKNKKEEEIPYETTASRISTNSFADWNTLDTNGNSVPVISRQGLTGDIENFKKQKQEIQTQLANAEKAYNDLPEGPEKNRLQVMIEELNNQLPTIDNELRQRRLWYNSSVEAALTNQPSAKEQGESNLTPEEVALYRKYAGTGELNKIQGRLNEATKDYNKTFGSPASPYSNKFTQWLDNLTSGDENYSKIQADRNELTEFYRVKEKVDKRSQKFLETVRYDAIDSDAISIGSKDQPTVTRLIFENPERLKIFNNRGESTKGIELDGKTMSFADNDLIEYMTKHKVKPNIEMVGTTTKIGSGNAVAKVTFNDPNGEISSTPYYIELTPELQRSLGSRFLGNKDSGVDAIARNLLDDEANNLRNQLITPSLDEPVTKTIFITSGKGRIPFSVTRFPDGRLSVTSTNQEGNTVPVPSNSGIPGQFAGTEDFIQQILKLKRK